MSKKKAVFITGAAGFIGFHLANKLLSRDDRVIGFDNFNAYYDPTLKRDRGKILVDNGIEMIEGDLADSDTLKNAIEKTQPTHVVNLAAQAGVRYSLTNVNQYIQSNIVGFINLLEILRHQPHIPLIYASSSSVYGVNAKKPFGVEDKTDQPTNLYGATKKSNEVIAFAYHHLFKIPMTGLRFFTVYGPWGRPDMAYFSFTKAISENSPIAVFNQGKMERDFTYIDDAINGTIAALDLSLPFDIFNLGNNRPESLEKFIGLLEEKLKKTAKKELKDMQAGDIVSTYADITHSQKLLGFQPTTSLDTGLSKFVEWYLNFYTKSSK